MSLRDALRTLSIEFREAGEHKNVRHGSLGVNCPKCSPHSNQFLCGIGLNRSFVSCWRCGRLGGLASTLASIANLPVNAVLAVLRESGVSGANQSDWKPSQTPAGKYSPPDGVGELLPVHRRYLEKRGYDPDYVYEHWGIRGIGMDGGRYKWRLFLPIIQNNRPVAWQTRAVGKDVEPRYLSSPAERSDVSIKHCLFGEQHARHSVIVVEGAFVAMLIGDGAVATCGVGYTEQQLVRIAKYPQRTIVFDNEPQAQRRASELADALSTFPGDTFIVNLSGPQPDSSPPEEICELRMRFLE